ncbi:hypothetical protein L2E82_14907 [Cichorium intybus]|uniref:Uncharacterized protein n=1 Tax=Cichorium intybus TaxID=13427 RepID=A0ACB9F1R6_CICIN|nr:hypothetical protein L2E82_14907 [Cichorium intybus]
MAVDLDQTVAEKEAGMEPMSKVVVVRSETAEESGGDRGRYPAAADEDRIVQQRVAENRRKKNTHSGDDRRMPHVYVQQSLFAMLENASFSAKDMILL